MHQIAFDPHWLLDRRKQIQMQRWKIHKHASICIHSHTCLPRITMIEYPSLDMIIEKSGPCSVDEYVCVCVCGSADRAVKWGCSYQRADTPFMTFHFYSLSVCLSPSHSGGPQSFSPLYMDIAGDPDSERALGKQRLSVAIGVLAGAAAVFWWSFWLWQHDSVGRRVRMAMKLGRRSQKRTFSVHNLPLYKPRAPKMSVGANHAETSVITVLPNLSVLYTVELWRWMTADVGEAMKKRKMKTPAVPAGGLQHVIVQQLTETQAVQD